MYIIKKDFTGCIMKNMIYIMLLIGLVFISNLIGVKFDIKRDDVA